MNTLLFYDCLGHQELENIAHDRRGVFIEFVWREGWDGWVILLTLLRILDQ